MAQPPQTEDLFYSIREKIVRVKTSLMGLMSAVVGPN